jgi:3-deoxy-D-manno-octulosonate 8-phosphate phosphatase (KDO 8-P phosphatase)
VNGTGPDSKLAAIRLVVFDVDGVFTDGRFYLSDDGVESKAFSTQDGFGIRRLLQNGVDVAVISGRVSAAVDRRMHELGVSHVFQGCRDKVAEFEGLIGHLDLAADLCAYAGDDIPDLPLLRRVGCSIAVANAVAEVRDACDLVTTAAGGSGAVREICDRVIAAKAGG